MVSMYELAWLLFIYHRIVLLLKFLPVHVNVTLPVGQVLPLLVSSALALELSNT